MGGGLREEIEMADRILHALKLREEFADAVENGTKNFEIRVNDRGFQKGDLVQFRVVSALGTHISIYGELEEKLYEITYVISGWGLKDGYVAFGIKEVLENGNVD